MKSKSCDLSEDYVIDKTKDFAGLYKSAAETKKYAEKRKSDGSSSAETTKNQLTTPKRERSPNKSKKKGKGGQLDLSQITNETSTETPGRPIGTKDRVTSTPIANSKNESGKVKSIMKNSSAADQSLDKSTMSKKSPKKRNKSVSFMLEENEEVVPKRTKSEDSINIPKKTDKDKQKLKEIRKLKKLKKNQKAEKENKEVENNMEIDNNNAHINKKPIAGKYTKKLLADTLATPPVGDNENHVSEKKKSYVKKIKKAKFTSSTDQIEDESNQDDTKDTRPKKLKKKKTKSLQAPKSDGEPASKCQKMNDPDITEDLENLSIGDNAHTLSNMLDEMAVVDNKKKQELKKKFNKNKRAKGKQENTEGESGNEDGNEEVKEKWKKRRWNKDKKGEIDDEAHSTTVIVENLPIAIMLNYRKLLTDHFVKYGLIKRIGLAEVYPTKESKPVFTTTISFYSDGAAQQALQENNTLFEGSRMRVKPALPPTETTVVLRTYAELNDHAELSSLFHGAGKIRNIRIVVKGKKSISTAFIEFDGPESVERAVKLAATARLGKKKVHLTRYQPRDKTKQEGKKQEENDGNASDADSEDSNN